MHFLNTAHYRLCVIILISLMLNACGFQLRGVSQLSFDTLKMQGAKLSIDRDLKRSINDNGIKLVEKIEDADLILEIINEANEKKILSLSGTGVVREFELYYQVNYRTRQPHDEEWSKVQTVRMRRDYSYNDRLLLGKAEEEAQLNIDMHNDAIHEIVRRLSAVKTTVKPATNTQ